MRYLILSDIHSNLEALQSVLKAAVIQKYDQALVLGDLVGYGADPNAVVDCIRGLEPLMIVRGNHDKVAAGLDNAGDFNPMAKSAANWTRAALTKQTLEYLKALPTGPRDVNAVVEICHGSPIDEDQYVVSDLDILRSLGVSERPMCFFGHTHVATCASLDRKNQLEMNLPEGHPEFEITIDPDAKYLINPGSVGQPRDGDARAAYAIADTGRKTVTLYRVAYPIEVAQKKILDAGLPPMLAYRLGMGR
jgi:predicted phosphodiesterase